MPALAGQIVLPDRILRGRVRFGTHLENPTASDEAPDRFILPGFVDTHVHGGGGGDVIDGVVGIEALARLHARHGTTTLLATTVTRPWPEVMAMLRGVAQAAAQPLSRGARIAGAHLEGPFLNPGRLGAQPPFAILPSPGRVEEVLETGIVRVVTIAPELDGADAAIAAFARAGVRVSLGHTNADHAEAAHALEVVGAAGGLAAGTHLFNAMTGISGRAPGVAGAILDSKAAYAELILDTHHVHPATFALARDLLGDRLMLISDAMRATGLGDCDSDLGGQAVSVRRGIARLADGTLAGSVLTLDAALRHALAVGTPLVQAARLLSTNPARYLGLMDRGAIVAGKLADLVVLSPAMEVEEVWIGGERIWSGLGEPVQVAYSDDVAQRFRTDVAHRSDLKSPVVPD